MSTYVVEGLVNIDSGNDFVAWRRPAILSEWTNADLTRTGDHEEQTSVKSETNTKYFIEENEFVFCKVAAILFCSGCIPTIHSYVLSHGSWEYVAKYPV